MASPLHHPSSGLATPFPHGLPPPLFTTASRPGSPCQLDLRGWHQVCDACGFVSPEPVELVDAIEAVPGMWRRALAGPVVEEGAPSDRAWATARILLARDSLMTAATRCDHLVGGAEDLNVLGFVPTRPMPSTISPQEALALLETAATRLAVVVHRLDESDERRHSRGVLGDRRVSFDDVVQVGIHRAHRQFFELTRKLAAARLRLLDPQRGRRPGGGSSDERGAS